MKKQARADQVGTRCDIVHTVRHWLSILVSPLIISTIAAVLVAWGVKQPVGPWMWGGCAGLGCVWLFLYATSYTSIFRRPLGRFAGWRRARRFERPRILVLDGSLGEGKPSTIPAYYTDRRPDEWCHNLESSNSRWTIEVGAVQRLSEERFDIVINPFGEAYPEEDLALHTTLRQLAEYVSNGGVYVNVAGYPFWWQHNPTTNATTDSGRWELTVDQDGKLVRAELKPILSDSLLGISPDMNFTKQAVATKQDDLARKRFGEIAGEGGQNKVTVFRPYPTSIRSMIPLLLAASTEHIVFGAVPYGQGIFLFFGMQIDDQTKGFEKGLAAVRGWARYESNRRRP